MSKSAAADFDAGRVREIGEGPHSRNALIRRVSRDTFSRKREKDYTRTVCSG
jgi:hypothetical protein